MVVKHSKSLKDTGFLLFKTRMIIIRLLTSCLRFLRHVVVIKLIFITDKKGMQIYLQETAIYNSLFRLIEKIR